MFKNWLPGVKEGGGYHAHVLTEGQVLSTKAADTVVSLSLTNPSHWDGGASVAGVAVNESSVLGLSAAWACVNLLSGTIASLPLVIYRTDAQGVRTVATDHPLYRLLRESPNYDQTAMDFWEGGTAALELRGNMHARKVYSGRRLVALYPIHCPAVRRQTDGSLRYRWSEDSKYYDLPQEQVFHVRGFGGGPLGGLSTLSYGRQVFGLSSAVNTAAAKTFVNGVRPSIALTTDRFLGDQRNLIEKALMEKHEGAMNAGRPLILEAGLKPSNLSFSPEDAQMLESRGFSVEEICRLFGVPPIMIGHGEKTSSWGTGVQEVTLGFIKYTLRRRLKRIEQAIQKQLLTPEDQAAGIVVEFNLEGLLRGDGAGRSEFYRSMTSIGAMTINEVRALENLPPVAGGDVPRMQSQNIPINMSNPPALVAGGNDEN